MDSSAKSPCVGNCCLDDDLTCLGCFRSLQEIKEWGVVDDHRRRIILQNAKQRSEARFGANDNETTFSDNGFRVVADRRDTGSTSGMCPKPSVASAGFAAAKKTAIAPTDS